MANQVFYIAGGQGAANDTHVYRCYNGLNPANVIPVPIVHYQPTNARVIRAMRQGDPGFIMVVGDADLCYQSRDGGATWTQSAGMAGSGDLLSIGSNENASGLEVMVGGRDGLTWFSVDGGINFQQHANLPTPTGTPFPGTYVTFVYEQPGLAWYVLVYDPAGNDTYLYGASVGAMSPVPVWDLYGIFPGVRLETCMQLGATTMLFTGPTGAQTSYNLSNLGTTTISGLGPLSAATNCRFTTKQNSLNSDFGWMCGDNNELFDLNNYIAPFPVYALLTPPIPGQVRSTNVIGVGTFAMASVDGGGPGPYEWFNSFDQGATANAVLLSAPLEINGGDMMEGCVFHIQPCDGSSPDIYVIIPCSYGPLSPGYVIEISGHPDLIDGCWEVLEADVEETEEVAALIAESQIIGLPHPDCEECDGCENYLVEPCPGNPNDAFVVDCTMQDLSGYVGPTAWKYLDHCWTISTTPEDPTIAELVVFSGPYRNCEECESAPVNFELQNCADGSPLIASGAGYVVGQVISLVATPVLTNCWNVIGTTALPPDVLTDVLDTFLDCEHCFEGIQSYLVQNCDTGEERYITLIAAANPGDVLVLQNMTGYEGDSCWTVLEEVIEPGEDFPTLIGVVEDCETCGGPPPACYTLISCNPATHPDIPEAVSGGPGADLAGNIGQVVTVGVGQQCYTVLENFSCVAPVTIALVTPVGPDCATFTSITPVVIPTTIVGDCTTFTIPVVNNSASDHDFKLFINCLGTGITQITPAVQTIAAGATFLYEAEYCPLSAADGVCSYTVSGPCGGGDYTICYKAVEASDCGYFNICITSSEDCKPDCIEVGTVVPIDIGGTIDPSLYPLDITITITHEDTETIVYSETTTIANDVELDALEPSFIPTSSGKYCVEICIPGCDSKQEWCFDVCDPTGVYKDDCKKYHLFRPHHCGPQKYIVTVKEFGSNDVVFGPETWDVALDNYYHFEVPHDGIYIIEITDFITGAIIYSYAIFETCEIEKCFKILMDKIMCSCADPCCKKCNGTPQKEIEFARMTLNKLNPLYLTYLGLAAKYKVDSIGTHIVSEYTTEFLYTADQIMDKIRELLEKCDCLCHEHKNTKANRGGCTTC